jgi:outer membrane murein-binding lipoprotein Lpp
VEARRQTILLPAALAAAVLLAGCEPDDPKVRAEVAELRAKVAELEKKNGETRTSATSTAAPASSAGGISRETLRRNLEQEMPELRAMLTKAFPDYRVDTVNAAAIVTPEDSDYLPYTTVLSFGLSQGQGIASFSIPIGADRAGNWKLPDIEDLAASVGNLASSGAGASMASGSGTSGRGAMMGNNVRQIQWDQNNAGAPPPSSNNREPAPAPQQSQPSGNAPFPVQDSRTIQFD